LKELNMLNNGPLWEAYLIAQVAEVIAVAPHLVLKLRIGDRRHRCVFVESMAMLRKFLREISKMLENLVN
jgi:hypothetical protein